MQTSSITTMDPTKIKVTLDQHRHPAFAGGVWWYVVEQTEEVNAQCTS